MTHPPAPAITQYPGVVPAKGQSQAVFDANVSSFMDWQTNTLAPEMDAFAAWVLTVEAGAVAITLPNRLGEHAYESYTSDWNDATANGWYSGLGAANAPLLGWVTGLVTSHKIDWIKQEVFGTTSSDDDDSNAWCRFNKAGVWGAWFRVLSTETEIKALAASTTFRGVAPSAGDFGFSSDFDNIVVGGLYSISGSWVNGPWQAASTSYVATMQVIERQWGAGARFTQIVHEWGRTNTRTGTGDPVTWTDWRTTVNDVRMGAEVQELFSTDTGINTWYLADPGFVLTGVRIQWQYGDDVMSGYKSRPIQKFINGSWVTIAQV
ncbi:hypothetical protein JI58_07915 [Marinosulfonomonas sp. PRT-SC04]|nr:hypothetical protein JI58_07915 [Marinosulfonomonas sp. PRT-SC04]